MRWRRLSLEPLLTSPPSLARRSSQAPNWTPTCRRSRQRVPPSDSTTTAAWTSLFCRLSIGRWCGPRTRGTPERSTVSTSGLQRPTKLMQSRKPVAVSACHRSTAKRHIISTSFLVTTRSMEVLFSRVSSWIRKAHWITPSHAPNVRLSKKSKRKGRRSRPSATGCSHSKPQAHPRQIVSRASTRCCKLPIVVLAG